MSNMYGYNDYDGPAWTVAPGADPNETSAATASTTLHSDEEPEHNPLQVGFWMEGDSLAPPCGSSVSTIHSLLDLAEITSDDVLYDLGCGDARVCLEAFARCHCRTVGVEIEADLVQRANRLIAHWESRGTVDERLRQRIPRVLSKDLRDVLRALVRQAVHASTTSGRLGGEEDDERVTPDRTVDSMADLPLPTVIVMYLLPEAIDLIQYDLIQLLKTLPNNFRIVCNTWGIKSLHKIRAIECHETSLALTPLMLYTKDSLP